MLLVDYAVGSISTLLKIGELFACHRPRHQVVGVGNGEGVLLLREVWGLGLLNDPVPDLHRLH